MVKIGRHLIPCISANDFIDIGERRWHALHSRASMMLEDARADSSQRVEIMKAVYDLRDHTTRNAVQHAHTLEGAIEIIQHAMTKAKITAEPCAEAIEGLELLEIHNTAYRLCGLSVETNPDPK